MWGYEGVVPLSRETWGYEDVVPLSREIWGYEGVVPLSRETWGYEGGVLTSCVVYATTLASIHWSLSFISKLENLLLIRSSLTA